MGAVRSISTTSCFGVKTSRSHEAGSRSPRTNSIGPGKGQPFRFTLNSSTLASDRDMLRRGMAPSLTLGYHMRVPSHRRITVLCRHTYQQQQDRQGQAGATISNLVHMLNITHQSSSCCATMKRKTHHKRELLNNTVVSSSSSRGVGGYEQGIPHIKGVNNKQQND
ncbi:MAG: hypothetical protein FRX49_13641 [Trebouxia sp. A1-2]|nr:MAG: hypothetical protein FRX49_13641 [Trebouxia sp. A1-2]